MPTYEYACRLCDQQFEIFQSIKADPLSECPSCGENGLRRLIGRGAGIIFKGSGFYETDYKRDTSRGAAGESGEKAATTDKPAPATSEKPVPTATGSSKTSTESSSSPAKSDT